MIEKKEDIGGTAVAPGERFCFACRPGLSCFNTCCRDKRLPLWPYDLLRLRLALDLSSPEILDRYVELEFDPGSGWPALRLRLDEQGRCPFVTDQGCRVYPHRPAACRIYPLARAAAPSQTGALPDVVFLKQETTGCLGWDQSDAHTTDSWTEDQELGPYHEANDQLLPLFFHPNRQGRVALSPQQIHAVIAALYNLDIFKKMVEQGALDKVFDGKRIKAGLASDLDLLILGRDFLIEKLFGAN